MFEVRPNEPGYSLLSDPDSQACNRYGKSIDTVDVRSSLRGQSLNINGDESISENPNRYKQHGFYFNADNCIACHACETACSEKNDVPAHQAFRSVGFVEGGTYPAYQRINISLACNHCDDPVCLKGCPTRAYTKFAEYGAVLQDPDICFGCGYCTWVCPYNAPQLDPVKGQVSKCNMCVDRLEAGLKPACVSACLGKALDFGVVENIPEGREQCKTDIPGLPRTDITHPNVRFQQTKATHREMKRVDAMPIKYRRDDETGRFHSIVDEKHAESRQWNWRKLLLSHEISHTLFTLSVQAVMGAFLLALLGLSSRTNLFDIVLDPAYRSAQLLVLVVIIAFGLFKLNMHLGKPHRFYRGFNNLRHSPVSREIAGISGFFAGLCGVTGLTLLEYFWPGTGWLSSATLGLAILASASGLFGLYYMVKLYRVPARPFWDHWQTASAFASSALILGSILLAILCLPYSDQVQLLSRLLAWVVTAGLLLQTAGHYFQIKHLKQTANEGAASLYLQRTRYGFPVAIRNVMLGTNLLIVIWLAQTGLTGTGGLLVGILIAVSLLVGETINRALFYAVVIPTTMPGAFFWKNLEFSEHAREVGLADMPQLGVAYERHHPFNWKALLNIARTGRED